MVSSEPKHEQQPLTNEEKNVLRKIRDTRFLYVTGAYLTLSFVLVEGWVRFVKGNPLDALRELFKFRFFATQYLLLIFIALTYFFLRYYFQVAYPYVKDVKCGMKDVVLFTPEKYKTPFFEDYYLETPLKKRSLIKVSREVYKAIHDGTIACLHLSVHAEYVLLVDIEGRKMKFNGSDSFMEL